MFSVIHGSPQCVWAPVKPGATIYVGGLVAYDSSAKSDQGIIQMPVAAGISNITNLDIPFGVCIGTNNKTPVFSTTYQTEYITAVAAGAVHGATTEFVGVEGYWSKGDIRAMVKVAVIDPCTVLRGNIYNAAVGTAPTLLTATVASTDGLGTTTNATQVTPVADLATVYCRTGGNAGAYRILDTTSTTVHTWTQAMNNDIAIGDTFVIVPNLPMGTSFLQIGATAGMWVEASATPATNYFIVNVLGLNLREAGKEFIDFRFDGDNFASIRA